MHADSDTICAGLLHDTLEDTNATKEDIASLLNKNIANLVDGVTKISKLNFSSKKAQHLANTRKIVTGITEDVRIIIIKLADRLHNMRTLQFKTPFKQQENALETMEIFVPLAYYIGAYRIKSELEDLSLRYLKPDTYLTLEEKKQKLEFLYEPYLKEMLFKIQMLLNNNNIPNEVKIRTKNIYGINMYQSLHTTVFGPNDQLVQIQIRTFAMDKVASFGLATYWDIVKDAREIMQQDLKEKYQFFKSLVEINKVFGDNQEFILQIKKELFTDKIYVYTTKGEVVELPKGATPIDFAYKIHTDIGNTMVGAVVNEEHVPIDYELKNKDRVKIITDELSFGPREEWLDKVVTTRARKKIKEFERR